MRKAKKAQLSVLIGYEHYRDDVILRGDDGVCTTTSPHFAAAVELGNEVGNDDGDEGEDGEKESEKKSVVAMPMANVLADEVLETVVRGLVKTRSRSRRGVYNGEDGDGNDGGGNDRKATSVVSFVFQKFD